MSIGDQPDTDPKVRLDICPDWGMRLLDNLAVGGVEGEFFKFFFWRTSLRWSMRWESSHRPKC
jgi:hypothetical protein